MLVLALRSLRHRSTAQAATFVAIWLGTVWMGSFATLLESSSGTGVSDADAETLSVMGGVVGGWASAIVLFAIVSTLATNVRQRTTEIGLLRTVGATPGQVARLVRAETLVVALIAAPLGAALSLLSGRALLATIRGRLVADDVPFAGTPVSVGAAAATVVVVAMLATVIAGRRATSSSPTLAARTSEPEDGRLRPWRAALGVLLVLLGAAGAVVTVTVTADVEDPNAAMMTAANSSILAGLGLALLAPLLLRWSTPALRFLLGRGASAELAAHHTTHRTQLLSSVLAPVIVLTSTAVGVLMLVGVDARTVLDGAPEADTIALLNNVVVGMLVLFASIVVVNALVAMLAHRRSEFRQLWMIGATPGQIHRTVSSEAAVVATLGVVLGTLAAMFTVVPFAIARDEGPVPDGQLWLPLVVAAGVAALTLTTARIGAGRVSRRAIGTAGTAAG